MQKRRSAKLPKYRRIKTVTIHGKRYDVKWRRPHPSPSKGEIPQGLDGKCDGPRTRKKAIYMHPNKDPWVLLETVAHEMLHGGDGWALAEELVDQYGQDLVKYLKRMKMKISFE